MTISNNYTNLQQNRQKRQQQSFGNALAPVVGFATFIENNGFLGEFLTVDAVGMGAPRTIQGYNRNKEELGHLNHKAGREEMVRELLSGPAFFFIPAGVLGLASMLRGKATGVTTGTLKTFEHVMDNTAKKITNVKDSKAIKTKFVHDLLDTAFAEGFDKERGQIDKIKNSLTEYIHNGKKPFLVFNKTDFNKTQGEVVEALRVLNKSNGQFVDDTSKIRIKGNELDIAQMVADVPNYLEHFTKSVAKESQSTPKFVEDFHETAKKVRQATNILAGATVGAFLLVIPKLYQTGKEFPGLEGLDAQKASKGAKVPNKPEQKDNQPKGKDVTFSGKRFDKFADYCNIDQHKSFTREMFFTLSGIFMLGARFKESRGEDERREVLTRDIPAVVIAVFGARAMNQGLAWAATKLSGIPVLKRAGNGKDLATQKQVKDWYTDFKGLKNPLVTFSETVHRHGGNLNKVMKKLGLTEDVKGIVGKEKATNKEIIDALYKAKEANCSNFSALEGKLVNECSKDNALYRRARDMQGSIKIGSILMIASVLGYVLPQLNIITTKKKYQKQAQQNQPIAQPK